MSEASSSLSPSPRRGEKRKAEEVGEPNEDLEDLMLFACVVRSSRIFSLTQCCGVLHAHGISHVHGGIQPIWCTSKGCNNHVHWSKVPYSLPFLPNLERGQLICITINLTMVITLGIEAASMYVCSIIVYFFSFKDVALYDPGQGQETETDAKDYGKVRHLHLHEQ